MSNERRRGNPPIPQGHDRTRARPSYREVTKRAFGDAVDTGEPSAEEILWDLKMETLHNWVKENRDAVNAEMMALAEIIDARADAHGGLTTTTILALGIILHQHVILADGGSGDISEPMMATAKRLAEKAIEHAAKNPEKIRAARAAAEALLASQKPQGPRS
jgi:hypothetical protein